MSNIKVLDKTFQILNSFDDANKSISLKDLTYKKPGTGFGGNKIKLLIGRKLSRFVSSKVLLKPKHLL